MQKIRIVMLVLYILATICALLGTINGEPWALCTLLAYIALLINLIADIYIDNMDKKHK